MNNKAGNYFHKHLKLYKSPNFEFNTFKQNVCVQEKFVVVILKAGHFIISSNLSPLLRIHIQLQIVEIIIQQQTSLVHHHLRNQKFHPENVNI